MGDARAAQESEILREKHGGSMRLTINGVGDGEKGVFQIKEGTQFEEKGGKRQSCMNRLWRSTVGNSSYR